MQVLKRILTCKSVTEPRVFWGALDWLHHYAKYRGDSKISIYATEEYNVFHQTYKKINSILVLFNDYKFIKMRLAIWKLLTLICENARTFPTTFL